MQSSGLASTRTDTYSWYVCSVMLLTYAFNYMDRSLLSVVVGPIEHEFGISDTTFGLLQGAAFGVFYCLFLFPLARLADRGNRRNLLMAAVVVWCSATVFCGLARTVPELFAARIMTAVGEAIVFPCAISILSDYFEPRRRVRAISIYSIGAYLGAALALGGGGILLKSLGSTSLSLPLVGDLAPWRVVFVVAGGLGFVLLPLLLAVKEPTRRNDSGDIAEQPYTFRQVCDVFKAKRYAIGTAIAGFGSMSVAAQTIQAWAPTMFVRAHAWSAGDAAIWMGALTLTMGPIGAICGALLTEAIARRGARDAKFLVGGWAAACSVLAGLALTLNPVVVALAGAGLLNFLVGSGFSLCQAALAELVPNRMRAQTTALYSITTMLFASTVGPLMIGVLNDHVFHDPAKIALSMRIVLPTTFAIAALALLGGRGAFRRALPVAAAQAS
jgi:MFS family permease